MREKEGERETVCKRDRGRERETGETLPLLFEMHWTHRIVNIITSISLHLTYTYGQMMTVKR